MMHHKINSDVVRRLNLCRIAALDLGMSRKAVLLAVDVPTQMLCMISDGQIDESFPVSTSQNGLGEQENSYKTPRGFHEVSERFGESLPAGAVLEARRFTGNVLPPDRWSEPEGDKILTRILRLTGRVPGFNAFGSVDSFARMIYLHGTNQEQFVGVKPASKGCIRMKNNDIITLFNDVADTPVWCWIGSLADEY